MASPITASHQLHALSPLPTQAMHDISTDLLASLKAHLQDPAGATMLPSYIYRLPSGREKGTTLAVDLGGSTLRVAVIRLSGGSGAGGASNGVVLGRRAWTITDDVKQLRGNLFFDWVAGRVAEVVGSADVGGDMDVDMAVGLTWSFPIVQTSAASGELQQMGKGFRMYEGIEGTDLRGHFESALRRKGLKNLHLEALLNDTTATLIAHAYTRPQNTTLSLICGTGVNSALILPIRSLNAQKFGQRTHSTADVIVNTESSMFGHGIFPLTAADRALDAAALLPGFQMFEQLTSGRYLGEVVRLNLVEAGMVALRERWALKTELVAEFEGDVVRATAAFEELYGSALAAAEVEAVTAVCRAVATRAAAYLAIMMFALYRLQRDAFADGDREGTVTVVACCGAVVEKHPSLRRQCQEFLDLLAGGQQRLILEVAEDSGLMGAAVGAVVADQERARL